MKNIIIIITESQLDNLKKNNPIDLPKHIKNSLISHHHSLGEHPSFPPDDDMQFEEKILLDTYKNIKDKFNGIDITPDADIKTELFNILSEIQSIESKYKDELEYIAYSVIDEIFHISDKENIKIELELNENVECNTLDNPYNDDFEFSNIEEMENINSYIYKKRLMNCLIEGISYQYLNKFDLYINEIFKLSSKLPELYHKFITLYICYLFEDKSNDSIVLGNNDVVINEFDNNILIKIKGKIFLSLIYESIKGMLQFLSLHGMPEDRDQITYISSKADFNEPSKWDLLLGISLWDKIFSNTDEEYQDSKLLPHYYVGMIASEPDDFHSGMKEVFGGTKLGKASINALFKMINDDVKMHNFNQLVTSQNDLYNPNDNFLNF